MFNLYEILRNSIEHIYNYNKNVLVTILLVIFIRMLLRKSPKKYSYYLWIIVIIRMIFPISIQSIFSIYNLEKVITPIINNNTINQIITITQPQYYTNALNAYENLNAYGEIPGFEIIRQSSYVDISVIWLFGMVAFIVFAIGTYIDVKRNIKTAIKLKDNIYQSDNFTSPFVIGFIKPKIIIPYNLEEQTQRIILEHEQLHIKRKDYLIRIIFYVLAIIYWINPFVWVAYHLFIKDMEMSCDEYVLSNNNEINKTYSYTLLHIASNQQISMPRPLAFGENAIKERVKNVLHWKQPNKKTILLSICLCLYCLLAFTTDPTNQKKLSNLIVKNGISDIKQVNIEIDKLPNNSEYYLLEIDSYLHLRDINKILNLIEINDISIQPSNKEVLTTLTILVEELNELKISFTEEYDECIFNLNGKSSSYKVINKEFTKEVLNSAVNYEKMRFEAAMEREDMPNHYYDHSRIVIREKNTMGEYVDEEYASIGISIGSFYYGHSCKYVLEKNKLTLYSLVDDSIFVFYIYEVEGSYQLIFNELESNVIENDMLERLKILVFEEEIW